MDESDFLAERFEAHRAKLRSVAYRMLGSLTEADDAVQEAWLRLSRAGDDGVDNLGAWLTTVVGRVCLDMLRSRTSRREEPYDTRLPDPVVTRPDADPEHAAVTADSVGLALLVVLESLGPAERLAFVLHDMFGVPFEEIAPVIGRNAAAARQLASRARRRVRGAAPVPDPDVRRQRAVVDAFVQAARYGEFADLVAVLHPDVVLHADVGPGGAGRHDVRGAENVARQARMFRRGPAPLESLPALVNGVAGLVNRRGGETISVMAFTVTDGLVAEIDLLVDPARLARLDLAFLDG